MALAIWPDGLPQHLQLAPLEETAPAVVARTEMDVGPAKVRRRLTAAVRLFQAELVMTAAQLELFDEFFVDTIAGGAEPFEWKHPRTNAEAEFRVVGQPTYRQLAPQAEDDEGDRSEHWRVRFVLELLPTLPEPLIPPPGPEDEEAMLAGWVTLPEDAELPGEEEPPADHADPFAFDETAEDPLPLFLLAPAAEDLGESEGELEEGPYPGAPPEAEGPPGGDTPIIPPPGGGIT